MLYNNSPAESRVGAMKRRSSSNNNNNNKILGGVDTRSVNLGLTPGLNSQVHLLNNTQCSLNMIQNISQMQPLLPQMLPNEIYGALIQYHLHHQQLIKSSQDNIYNMQQNIMQRHVSSASIIGKSKKLYF